MSKMIYCKLCETKELIDAVCLQCGFNNESGLVDDFEKLRIYHRKLNKEGPWLNEVKLIKQLNKILRLSFREIEEKIDIKKSMISLNVKLAEGIEKYPELQKCKNKSQAIRDLQEKESNMNTVRSLPGKEIEIQKYLYNNWEETPFSEKWELVKKGTQADGNYDAGNGGILDLLAKGRNGRDWLVIELKRDQASDETVGQLLRYMGWVKENLSKEKDVVHGLIIASSSDKRLKWALSCAQNTSYRIFRKKDNIWEFISHKVALIRDFLQSLPPEEQIPPEEQKKIIEKLLS